MQGQSILEVITAMAIFSLIALAMAALAVGGFVALEQGGEQTQAEALAQEGIEAVRTIRDRDWGNLSCSNCIAEVSGSEWILYSGTNQNIGQYTRTITLSEVYRDSNNDIVAQGTPGATLDEYTKLVEVEINWTIREGITNKIERIAYLVNWWYDEFDINTFCISLGYINGTCRANDKQCISNGEVYEPGGDQYCPGGGGTDTCCCAP